MAIIYVEERSTIKITQAYLTVFSMLIQQTVSCLCNFHHILSNLYTVCLDESKINVIIGTTKLWIGTLPTLPFVKFRTQIFFNTLYRLGQNTVFQTKIFLLFYKCHSVVLNLRLNRKVFYNNICGFCNVVDRYTITHNA